MGCVSGWLVAALLVTGCGHEAVEPTLVPEVCPPQNCPPPEVEYIYREPLECKEARKVMRFRNARLDERMDECEAKGNSYVDCTHWVFGYFEPDPGS